MTLPRIASTLYHLPLVFTPMSITTAGTVTKYSHTFHRWLKALDRYLNSMPDKHPDVVWNETETNADCWRDLYDDGLTPQEAWAEQEREGV